MVEIKNMKRMRNTGIRFKEIRAQLNLTQSQVAESLGIARSLIAKSEKGKRSMGAAILERACRLFKEIKRKRKALGNNNFFIISAIESNHT